MPCDVNEIDFDIPDRTKSVQVYQALEVSLALSYLKFLYLLASQRTYWIYLISYRC